MSESNGSDEMLTVRFADGRVVTGYRGPAVPGMAGARVYYVGNDGPSWVLEGDVESIDVDANGCANPRRVTFGALARRDIEAGEIGGEQAIEVGQKWWHLGPVTVVEVRGGVVVFEYGDGRTTMMRCDLWRERVASGEIASPPIEVWQRWWRPGVGYGDGVTARAPIAPAASELAWCEASTFANVDEHEACAELHRAFGGATAPTPAHSCPRCAGPAVELLFSVMCERVGGCMTAEERIGEPHTLQVSPRYESVYNAETRSAEKRMTHESCWIASSRLAPLGGGRWPYHQATHPTREGAIALWRAAVGK